MADNNGSMPVRRQCRKHKNNIMVIWWSRLIHFNVYVAAFSSARNRQSIAKHDAPSLSRHKLYGISEWRAKFSSLPPPPSDSQSTSGSTLPLLLLPFKPDQILLPGQATTLKFRHGKYMDMIDESLTSYESVVGMSILGDDGFLPHVVVCEVLEEELEVNMGYRGFGGMEVGVRAVGRAQRMPNEKEPKRSILGGDDISFRGRAALDDIHLGHCVEIQDDVLDGDGFDKASEYLGNIESLLMLPQQSDRTGGNASLQLDARKQSQQMLFTKAYKTSLGNVAENSKSQQQQHAQLMASSWATFAAAEGSGARSSSTILQALATKDTVERLRLGLTTILESQMPSETDSVDAWYGGIKKKVNNRDNSFQ